VKHSGDGVFGIALVIDKFREIFPVMPPDAKSHPATIFG
jgi:hypothetical protein